MRDNNEHWYGEQNRANYNEKLRPDNFFQRNKLMIIILSTLVVLVVIFASTTFYLLTKSQAKTPTNAIVVAPTPTAQSAAANATSDTATATPPATPAPALGATVTSPAQASASIITTTTKNYQFICITNCDDKFSVVLNDITLNTTSQTMAWDFTITENGNVCSGMRGQLALQSPSGDTITADGGTLLTEIAINANQTLPRTATFSSIPHQGIRYTANFGMRCVDLYSSSTYQAVLFSY